MTSGFDNIALGQRFVRCLMDLNSRLTFGGVRVLKATITEDLISMQLEPVGDMSRLFPEAVLRTRGDQSFYVWQDGSCRLVWEANSDESD